MWEPLFRVNLKQQFPIMFTVYIIHSLLTTNWTFLGSVLTMRIPSMGMNYPDKLTKIISRDSLRICCLLHVSLLIKCIDCNLLKQKESLKGLFKQSINRAGLGSVELNCWKLLKVENHVNNWLPNISSFCS